MRPTFMGFETARRGMMATQKAIDITGNNLSNINTRGYTRQRVDLVSISQHSGTSMYAQPKSSLAGQGVQITGVSQIRDPFLDKRFREEYSTLGYYDQSAVIFEDIEAALDEITSSGLKDSLADVINSLDEFSKHPDQLVNGTITMNAFKNLTLTLDQFNDSLNDVMKQQKFDMDIAVNDVNAIMEKISMINKDIADDVYSNSLNSEYHGPNELMDQRNLLLDELSRYGDVQIFTQSDGTVNVEMDGKVVVEGDKFSQMEMVEYDNETVGLKWLDDGSDVRLESGALTAFVNLINGAGQDAFGGQTFDKGIPFFKNEIDRFAAKLVDVVNNSIPESEKVPATDPPTYIYKKLLQGDDSGSIEISDEWANDPGYIITDESNGADGELDNSFILQLKDNMTKKTDFGSFNGSFEEYVNNYNSTIGQERDFYLTRIKTSASVADEILNRRDSISAVSMDEEGGNLMIYDKAYKAVARVMTTMDEALDVLINKTGLVGR